jgi:hypothetical protein
LAASAQDVGQAQTTAAPQAGRKRIELSPWRACSLLFRAPALRVDLPLIEAIQDQHRCSALSAHAQGKRWIVEERSTRPRTCLQQRFPQRLKIQHPSKSSFSFLKARIAGRLRLTDMSECLAPFRRCACCRRSPPRHNTPKQLPPLISCSSKTPFVPRLEGPRRGSKPGGP